GFAGSSSNTTVNFAGAAANVAAVGVIVAAGPTVSNAPDRLPAVPRLPSASWAAPAGTVTVNAPSAVRLRVKVNTRPGVTSWKFETVTAPVRARSDWSNPVSASEKVTLTGMLAALLGRGAVVVTATAGPTLSNVTLLSVPV